MASIGSMPVWSRDLGLFNKKRQEVIDFSTNNHRSLIEGDYENIKITSPDDLIFGKAILQNQNQ